MLNVAGLAARRRLSDGVANYGFNLLGTRPARQSRNYAKENPSTTASAQKLARCGKGLIRHVTPLNRYHAYR